MKTAARRLAGAVVAVLLCGFGAPSPGSDSTPESSPAARGGRRQTVAVFPFDNNAVTDRERLDFLREWLPDSIGAALHGSQDLRVVERRELVRILQEQKLGSSDLASKEGRLELGKIIGAQTMIFGGFTAIAGALSIDARIVDVESGAILKTTSAQGLAGDARRLGEEISQRMTQGLGIAVAAKGAAAGLIDSRALEGAEHYYRGLALEKEGKTDEAIESYRRAIQIDREDGEARAHLKKLLNASD